jgi:hypothetical protein
MPSKRDENQDVIDLKFEYDNEMYSWQRAKEWSTYFNTLEAQYVDQLNRETVTRYQDLTAFTNWQDRENMRLYSYANEVQAYNASVTSYYEQLDFNDIAEELTLNDTARAYQDQLISIGFQNEDLINKWLEGGKSVALETKGLTDKVKQAKAVEKLQIKETNINREFDLINNALDKVGLRDGMAATKADAAFKIQGMKTESLQKVGQQKALGQVGRSAEKAMQAILANHGNAQMALMNSISNAEDKYNLDVQKLTAALENKTKLTNLQYSNITNQFTTAKTDIKRAQEGVDLTFKQLKTATDFGKEQLQMSLLSASEQNKADRERINMDKYQADINASQSLKTVPKAPPQQKLPLLIPDTVYNKVPEPIKEVPLPRREINTVHDTSFGDALVNIGMAVATAGTSNVMGGESFFP